MANIKRLEIDGYGQLELNNVAFRRDGRIEAQCGLDSTDFASVPAENGMVLAVDKLAKSLKFVTASETLPVALNFSSEHMYDERKDALKDFKIEYKKNDYFLPRMGYFAVGDLFTTNCIAFDSDLYPATTETTTDEVFKEALQAISSTNRFYAVPSTANNTHGAWLIQTTAPTTVNGCTAEVVKVYTMPDGQFGVKLRIIAL